MAAGEQGDLRARVADYLRAHHTMTIATTAPPGGAPHAAHVFYAVDDDLRLIFLSQTTSLHAQHIGTQADVAVTVSEEYEEWRLIQGVQLWGTARLLAGPAEAKALVALLQALSVHPRAPAPSGDHGSAARYRRVSGGAAPGGFYRQHLRCVRARDPRTGLRMASREPPASREPDVLAKRSWAGPSGPIHQLRVAVRSLEKALDSHGFTAYPDMPQMRRSSRPACVLPGDRRLSQCRALQPSSTGCLWMLDVQPARRCHTSSG